MIIIIKALEAHLEIDLQMYIVMMNMKMFTQTKEQNPLVGDLNRAGSMTRIDLRSFGKMLKEMSNKEQERLRKISQNKFGTNSMIFSNLMIKAMSQEMTLKELMSKLTSLLIF